MGAGACMTREESYSSEGEIYSLEKVMEIAEPLDLIVFRGDWAVSEFIGASQVLGNGTGKWSHVGIVVTTDVVPIINGTKGKKYIWESNTTYEGGDESNCPNTETGKGHNGVQFRDMEETIKTYIHPNCIAGIIKLKYNPWLESASNPEWRAKLVDVMGQLKDATKDLKFTEITLDVWTKLVFSSTHTPPLDKRRDPMQVKEKIVLYKPQMVNMENIPNDVFCSAFACLVYQVAGVLPLDYDCMKVAPVELVGLASNDGYIMPITKKPIIVKSEDWSNVEPLSTDEIQ